jgi:hypothetical protein
MAMPWVNYEDAMTRVRAYSDLALEQFVMRAVNIVVQRFAEQRFPAEKLDMLYFVEVQEQLYEQKAALIRVLNGEDLSWFGQDH